MEYTEERYGISGGCLIFQLIIFIRKWERIGQRLSGSPSSDGGTIKEMSEMATNRDMKMSFIIWYIKTNWNREIWNDSSGTSSSVLFSRYPGWYPPYTNRLMPSVAQQCLLLGYGTTLSGNIGRVELGLHVHVCHILFKKDVVRHTLV